MKRSKGITLVFLGIALTACSQEPEKKSDGFWTAGDDLSPAKNDGPQPTFTTPPPQVAAKKEDGGSSFTPFFLGYLLSSTLNGPGYSQAYAPQAYPSVSPKREEERRSSSSSSFVYINSGSGYGGGSGYAPAAASRSFLNASNNRVATNTPITRPATLPAPARVSVPSVPRSAAPVSTASRGGFGSTGVSSAS